MKFPALNAECSTPSADPLGPRRPAHASEKKGYPSKMWLFHTDLIASSSMKTVADRHRHPAYESVSPSHLIPIKLNGAS